MGLTEFVAECQKVDSRIELTKVDGNKAVVIGNNYVVVEGYNFPFQAHIITNLMKECGSFE
ncbi:MAG: hypothetical protein IKN15_04710 [Bacteroidaceae bacterium]|nr:hypothetical protein [Bacteroidaceae bacterium]